MGAFGQWDNGPIQFNRNTGGIESRGTADGGATPAPPPSADAGPVTPTPAPSPSGGGVLPYGGGPNPGWGLGNGSLVEPVTPASNNGGSYGIGGGGGLDSSNGSGSTISFDDGGAVGDGDADDGESDGTGDQQGAQASTLDPMSAVQRTLQYGRKKMGLPVNFSDGNDPQQSSFDDGGEVGDEDGGVISMQGQSSGGQSTPDPRAALSYLTGAGNVSPEIADALERKLDPQGTMNASTRTIHAIASAPTPDSAFGLMQHYRTRYNAYAGGARAALDQGNVGQAAAHATQAFQNVPTGYDVRFAPARGGVALSAKKLGPQKSQAPQQPVQGFDTGGEVDDDDNDQGNGGVIPAQPSVTYDENNDASYRDPETSDPAPYVPQDPATDQPTVLTPDQFKKIMAAGYDKPLDSGFANFLSSMLSTPAAAADNPPDPSKPAVPIPAARPSNLGGGSENNVLGPLSRGDFSGAGSGIAQNIRSLFGKPGQAAPDVTAAVTDPSETPAGQAGPTPNQQPPGGQRWQPTPSIMAQMRGGQPQQSQPVQTGPQQSTVGKSDRQQAPQAPGAQQQAASQPARPAPVDMVQKYADLWDRLHPNGYTTSGGGEQQRVNFIKGMIDQETKKLDAMEIEGNKGRGDLQAAKFAHDSEMRRLQQEGANNRNANTNTTRRELGQNTQEHLDQRALANNVRSRMNAITNANPGIKPEDLMKQLSVQFGVPPQDIQRYIQMGQPQQRQQGAAQQGGQQQGGAPQLKYFQGKLYQRGPNGEAIPVN